MSKLFGDEGKPFLSLVVAAKASGKSEVVKFIIYQYRDFFNYIVVFCPTSLNGFYSFLPQKYVYDRYDPVVMQNIIKRQEDFIKQGKKINCLVIFDDVLADDTINFEKRQGNELLKVFSANRHILMSAIFISQKLKGLPKLLRENADYAVIGRVLNSAYDDLYESFGYMDKKDFREMIHGSTQNFNFLRFKASVAHSDEHFSTFKVPEGFLNKKFSLSY